MGCSSGGVSVAICMTGGWYVWTMELRRECWWFRRGVAGCDEVGVTMESWVWLRACRGADSGLTAGVAERGDFSS